jgi:hypothetical protein
MTDDTVLGDSLAVLSLRVATEVDKKLGGKTADPKVFAEFTKELSKASGLDLVGESAFLQSDPMTTEVFAQAIREASHERVLDVSSLSVAVKKNHRPPHSYWRSAPGTLGLDQELLPFVA